MNHFDIALRQIHSQTPPCLTRPQNFPTSPGDREYIIRDQRVTIVFLIFTKMTIRGIIIILILSEVGLPQKQTETRILVNPLYLEGILEALGGKPENGGEPGKVWD